MGLEQFWLLCQMLMMTNAPNTITEAPVASPSSPSVRFTPLLVPAIITSTQITSRAVGSSRAVEVTGERDRMRDRRLAGVVLHADREPGEDQADDHLADELGLAAQTEVALLEDLDEVVEEADRAEAGEQEQQQQRRCAGRPAGLEVVEMPVTSLAAK